MDFDRALSQLVSIIVLSLGLLGVMLMPLVGILTIGRIGRGLGGRRNGEAPPSRRPLMRIPDATARVEAGGAARWLPPIRRRKAH